jgi:DNA-binding MarR family transcriptional regulator
VDDEDALTAQLFGSLFVLMQRLSRRADDELASLTLTSRQWLLLAVITRAFPDASPTLSQAAAVYGTSRQNIKQIARQLQQQGWLRIVRDPDDARATRLELTDKVAVFADPAVQARQQQALTEMFGGLSPHERRSLHALVEQCLHHLDPAPAPVPQE